MVLNVLLAWNYYSSHNVKVSSEPASADLKAAKEFLEILGKLIMEESCLPEQMFNMDEASLLWKWMPERISSYL